MDKVRIGILGVGWWGTVGHLVPLMANPQVEVAAIWSRTEAKVRARAKEHSVGRWYTDWRRLLDEVPLDGLVIASTPNMHYEQARYALERGLHVLVEKPFVLKAQEALELERMAKERRRILSVCHPVLFTPALIRARQLLDEQIIGPPVLVSAVHAQRVIDLYRGRVSTVFDSRPGQPAPGRSSYSDPSVAGGGEGYTQATHVLGTLLWLTGIEPTHVYCAMNPLDTKVDVIDAMVIRFRDGCLASVGANGLLPAGVAQRGLFIHGAEGILHVDGHAGIIKHFGAESRYGEVVELHSLGYDDARAEVGANFVRCIMDEASIHVSTQIPVYETLILDAAYRSAESRREEPVSPL